MKLWVLLMLVGLLLPAAAVAQAPVATPAQGIEDEDPGVVEDPEDGVEDPSEEEEEPGDEEDDYDVGGDEDYYTGCDPVGYGDGGYYYCPSAGGGPRENGGGEGGGGGGDPPAGTYTAGETGATLPATGSSALILAWMGLALILIGSGGRLLTSRE